MGQNIYRLKKHLPYILLVIILTLISWGGLTTLTIRGEGYLYLTKRIQEQFWNGIPGSLLFMYVSAPVLGSFYSLLFGTEIKLYYVVVLISACLLNTLFYFLVYTITKKKYLSLICAIIFGFSYFGQWGILGDPVYGFYLERHPPMFFAIISFLFLNNSLKTQKRKHIILTVIFFILMLLVSRWTIIFVGLFIVLPLSHYIFDKKRVLIFPFLSIIFLFIAYLFIYIQQTYSQEYAQVNNSLFLLPINIGFREYFNLIFLQLTHWSHYVPAFKYLITRPISFFTASPENFNVLSLHSMADALNIKIIVAIIYFLVSVVIYLKQPKYRSILIALIISIWSIFHFNIYLGRYPIELDAGANRYLYLPTFSLAIFWGLFINTIIIFNKKLKIILYLIIFIYFVINTKLINTSINIHTNLNESVNMLYESLLKIPEKYEEGIIVKAGPLEKFGTYESEFFRDWAGNGKVIYLSENPADLDMPSSTKFSKIYVFYDGQCKCIRQEDY